MRRRNEATERVRSSCSPVALATVRRPRFFCSASPGRTRRQHDLRRHAGAADDALGLFFLGGRRRAGGRRRSCRRGRGERAARGGGRGRGRRRGRAADFEAAFGFLLGRGVWFRRHGRGACLPRACALQRRHALRARGLRALRAPWLRSRRRGALPPRARARRRGRGQRASCSSSVRVRSTTPLPPLRGAGRLRLAGVRAPAAGARACTGGGAAGAGAASPRAADAPRPAQRPALHLLDDDRLGAAMRKALPHNPRFHRPLQRQGFGRGDGQSAVAGIFRVQSFVPNPGLSPIKAPRS